MATFRVADVPSTGTIIQHIKDRSDFVNASKDVVPSPPHDLIKIPLSPVLFNGLKAAAEEAIAKYGLHAWLSSEGRDARNPYRSLSLTFNPDLSDPGIKDVHQSTLGTSANGEGEFYYGKTERIQHLKHSYFDTYGFRRSTPAAQLGMLGTFLSECRISPVRSRLSALFGNEPQDIFFEFGWHRDESVFENLRVNIPLTSDPNYRLQIEHERLEPDPESTTMDLYFLEPGYAYSFNTNKPHRVFPIAPSDTARVHLVLGFSPWLDYDPVEDAWKPNEFYGKVHPLDILRNGLLHPGLKTEGRSR